jgi:hypothetical protein
MRGSPELTHLLCRFTSLTDLNISWNTNINSIFKALPKTTNGKIELFDNPHKHQYTKSLATNKGWAVVDKK